MAASGGFTWDNPIPGRLNALWPKLIGVFKAASEFKARDIEGYMRNNAPWTDQTSNARNGLFAESFVSDGGQTFGIVAFHSVPYGIFLETRFSGRYAIIDPTLAVKGPEFMSLLNNIMRKVS